MSSARSILQGGGGNPCAKLQAHHCLCKTKGRKEGRAPADPCFRDAPCTPARLLRRCTDFSSSLPPPHPGKMTPGLTAAPWPASTQPRGPCAQTTLSLSPTQEAPLSLGELLNWFSEVSKSWISSSGGPDPTAPTKRLPSGDHPADLSGKRPGALSPAGGRDWPREEWKAHGPGVREQLLSLRHWLDALEKRLPDLQGKGPATEASAFAVGPPWVRDQEALGKLLSWVGDMEDLVAGQKPPSSEAKVVKAQLQEQKLLRRLLDERRSHVESLLQEKKAQLPPETPGPTEQQGWDKGRGLCSLREKWASLVQEAEARHCSLERILPAAQAFQESGDAFQEWLGRTERALAQLWRANGTLSRGQEACGQAQGLCQEIRSRPAELDQVLEHGQRLLEVVSGEEARLAQEKMDSLRMRFLMVSQSGADILQRLEQALEASSRLEPAQEDLALWLSRLEKELPSLGEGPVAPADREKLEAALRSALCQASHLEAQLEGLAQVHLETDAVRLQLEEQKLVSAGILHHQSLVERLVPIAGLMLSHLPPDVQQQVQLLVQPLQERTEGLLCRSAACAVSLEQAQSLVAQFVEAQGELCPWLQETRVAAEQFSPESLSCEAFKEQQELLQGLREAIAEHKPLITKLQRVSTQLATLNPQEATPFLQHCQEMEDQYSCARERVRQAAGVLEEAIPRYSQLSERMALMVESLERLRSRMQPPSAAVRGDPAWIQEQLRENGLCLAELEKLGVALETLRGQGAELLATVQTSANEEIQGRVEQLLHQWEEMWAQGEERERWLQSLLALAERFWHGLSDLTTALGDTQQAVMEPVEASSDPAAIRTRLEAMQALREEIDALQGDLDSLGTLSVELMSSCGDPEKPDVTKSLDELYSCWHSVSKAWAERQAWLEEQLQVSLAYQETLQRHLGWLGEAELRMAEAFLVAGNPELVKQQLLELKDFKRELYQRKVEVESARPQGGPRGADGKDPPKALSDFRERWSRLEEAAVGRQHQLEASLLGLGQFQSQLEELLEWLLRTTELLAGPPTLPLDLQSCEIELAKHKVLRNDVLSHARTVQSVKEAGQSLLLSGGEGEAGEGLQGRLQELSQRWDSVLGQTEGRQMQLESNLGQVQDITLEITDLLQWLEHVELQLCFHKPVWGQPEATKDKLVAHMELCKEMEAKQPAFHSLREAAQRLLSAGPCPRPSSSSSTEHSLSLLEQKWDSVAGQLQERKEQLNEGLAVTTEFHSSVQQLLSWVERMEEALGALPAPSCVLETLADQIQEQKALAKEAHSQSEKLAGLEALAARMQDRSTVQSLVLSGREHLARVAQQVAERGALLEESRQRARQFSESWQLLLDWLEEVDLAQALPSDAAAGQEAIRALLGEHKEFQKGLRSKRPVYEATLRSGRLLREKALLPEDAQPLEEMLQELKERWGAVSSWAAERQRKLEESLLFSGRFTDALQTLMDWLYQVEPQLAEESPVAGDRDLVLALMDKHKAFQRELGQRASCIKALQRCMRDLIRGSGRASSGDAQWLHSQVEELGQRWELICRLSLSKQDRLEAALRQAEEFHRLVHSFLGRLSELENSIKYGALPEDVAAVQQSQEHMKELRQGLQCQQLELECIASLGEEILSACHPDAAIAIKSWLTVTKTRFQEVLSWAQQQEERLQAQGSSLAAEQEEVARLTDWIRAAEEALALRDEEPLPEDVLQLEELSRQHTVFMEELNRKQPEVEKVTKSCKPPPSSELGVVPAPRRLASRRRGAGRLCPRGPAARVQEEERPGPQKPLLALLAHRWQQLWLLALDRQYRLQNAQQRQRELEAFSRFDFAVWRKRYLQWISRLKSRVLDVFRGIDRDQDGRVSLQEFIQSVLSSKFPTNALEMNAVANIFDMNRDGFIDYYEFVSTLHPTRDPMHKAADADQIQDEVNRQVAQCSCAKRFQVEQISANRYRFGESQQLRMVRILRSTLMVRVGGGWIALDEFLVKNDPCRVKGRTNVKINEKYLSADPSGGKGGSSQSAPASKALSPSSSSLSLFSSASAPSSPLGRKTVLRRTRSGDRCPRSSCAPREEDGAGAAFTGLAPDGEDPQAEAGPPDPPGEPPP